MYPNRSAQEEISAGNGNQESCKLDAVETSSFWLQCADGRLDLFRQLFQWDARRLDAVHAGQQLLHRHGEPQIELVHPLSQIQQRKPLGVNESLGNRCLLEKFLQLRWNIGS
jgi:hypothetical protein